MVRLDSIVVPAIPHHVTQRVSRSQAVFFGDDDYLAYKGLMSEHCRAAGVAVWAWRLTTAVGRSG